MASRARHYRDLAEEVRTKADSIKNREGSEVFEKLAADYDGLAESHEQAVKLLESN